MKKLTRGLFIISALAMAACTQPEANKNEAVTDPTAEKATIEKLESNLTAAMLSGNRDTLNSLTSDKLSYGHSNGDIQDKSGFVDSLATHNWGFTQINIVDQNIINIDGNTAVVRHKLFGEAKNKGKDPAKLALGVLQVWKKENGNWLLYARQGFKLLPPNDVPPAK